jgi:hypothetical protein
MYNFVDMIRKVLTPEEQNISICLPVEFIGKKVEVIAFTIDDLSDQPLTNEKPVTYFASEKTLAKDWLTPEEDKAWRDL